MNKNYIYYESFDKSFSYRHSRDNDNFNKIEIHNNYVILYAVEGVADYYIEGEKYQIKKDEILIINYNELYKLSKKSEDLEIITFVINKNFYIPFNTSKKDLFKSFNQYELGQFNLINKNVVNNYNLRDYFIKIEKFIRDNIEDKDILISCQIVELLTIINRIYKLKKASPSLEYNNAFKDVIKYINMNLSKKLSLDKITNSLFITKTYLCHIFKKKTGLSIIQYITIKRILLADDLISQGISAKEASILSGFFNYSNFYKSYKKITGHSPTGK